MVIIAHPHTPTPPPNGELFALTHTTTLAAFALCIALCTDACCVCSVGIGCCCRAQTIFGVIVFCEPWFYGVYEYGILFNLMGLMTIATGLIMIGGAAAAAAVRGPRVTPWLFHLTSRSLALLLVSLRTQCRETAILP